MDIRKYHFRSLLMTILATGVIPSMALAGPDHVSGYILDPSYNVRSAPNLESQREATLRETSDEAIRLERDPKNHDWLKLTRPNGGEGYVRAEARKQIQLNRTYILRTEPSLSTGKRIGLMSSAKSPILTGERKMVREGNKNIEWLRVIVDGKSAWVAGGVRRNLGSAPTPPTRSKHVSLTPVTTPPRAAAKPTVELPPVDVKPPVRIVRSAPIEHPEPPRRPRAERRSETPQSLRPVDSGLVTPPPADEPRAQQRPRVEQQERHAPAVSPESRPATHTVRREPENPECSKNAAEFRANPELRRAYGKMNPYVRWNNYVGWGNFIPSGANIEPTGGSRWKVYIPGQYLKMVDRKLSISYETILACADAQHRPYISLHGKQYFFSDENLDAITLQLGEKEFTYKRGEAVN